MACSAENRGDMGLIPDLGRSPGGGHGNPLQYSCLEYSMDRWAWWAIIDKIAKSQTRLKWLSMPHISIYVILTVNLIHKYFQHFMWSTKYHDVLSCELMKHYNAYLVLKGVQLVNMKSCYFPIDQILLKWFL